MDLTLEQIQNIVDTFKQCKEQIESKKEWHEEIKVDALSSGRFDEGNLHDELEFDCSTILVNINNCLKTLE